MPQSQSFTAEDVLVVCEGEKELGTLKYQESDGNFSGELTTAPSADGVELTATITTTGDATSSTVSIANLIKNATTNTLVHSPTRPTPK